MLQLPLFSRHVNSIDGPIAQIPESNSPMPMGVIKPRPLVTPFFQHGIYLLRLPRVICGSYDDWFLASARVHKSVSAATTCSKRHVRRVRLTLLSED